MVVTSKLRRHKVMERAMRALMGNNLPPRFKFKDTYDSIKVPTAYQQHLPSQATLEAKFDELIAEEEVVAPTTQIKADMVVSSNLEVGTSNLFVDTETGNVGIGTSSPAYKLDVHGTANVGALTATSISGPFSGNADTATTLQTARNINGVSFDGSGNITVNGLNYNVNNGWLREQGDNTNFKQYGNSRQMVFRTDGTTEYASGVGGYPFVWMYGGDAASNRRMFLNTSGQLWCSNYGWLHDKFMARTQVFTDNVANTTFSGQTIDHNCSGSDACTTDRVHRALFIDMDSSATGGDTGHEHRMYGIYSDVRHSGDSDLVYGMYSYTRSDHASGTTTNLRAADFTAQASGTGINTNIYGLNSYAIKDGGSTSTTTNMYGVRGEVEVDAGTCTNAYAFQSQIDRDGGTITNGYLYYGSYSGTVGTKWGVYVTGETKNYFSGNVGIGQTNPGYKLDVNGTLHAGNAYFDNVYIGGSTSRGLRAVSGNYGTVQTTGGGAGNWEGYSIDGRYVFMSKDNNNVGIYNDLDNEWMIYCARNSWTKLYYNGAEKLSTTNTGVSVNGAIYAPGHPVQYVGQNVNNIVVYNNATGRYITPLDITITPKFSNSKIMLHWVINAEAHHDQVIRVYRGSTLIGYNTNNSGNHSGAAPILYDTDHNSTLNTHTVVWVDTPNTTSAVTYRIYSRAANTGTNWFRLNRTVGGGSTGQGNHEIAVSYKSAMEIAV